VREQFQHVSKLPGTISRTLGTAILAAAREVELLDSQGLLWPLRHFDTLFVIALMATLVRGILVPFKVVAPNDQVLLPSERSLDSTAAG
jgi:hypothetical protein